MNKAVVILIAIALFLLTGCTESGLGTTQEATKTLTTPEVQMAILTPDRAMLIGWGDLQDLPKRVVLDSDENKGETLVWELKGEDAYTSEFWLQDANVITMKTNSKVIKLSVQSGTKNWVVEGQSSFMRTQ
jgi:hypothetical protein